MKKRLLVAAFLLLLAIQAYSDDGVKVYVIDVGAGLCTITEMPGPYYMIYDAGMYVDNGRSCFEATQGVIPEGSTVDLMVLSHSDADHLGAVDEILDAYKVKRIIRSGYRRSTTTWANANDAIKMEKEIDGAVDINLSYFEYPAGATYRLGDSWVTMVSGFHKPPGDWDIADQSEERNAGSIVIRRHYKGKSILFTGDAVGRHIGEDQIIGTEKYMVENAPVISIDSEVLIAPHHGADNGSSAEFIKAVSPSYVIFPAGHRHEHPRASAGQRYLEYGVDVNNIFCTDIGDDEDDQKEWNHGEIDGHEDDSGDDDVLITVDSSGEIEVVI